MTSASPHKGTCFIEGREYSVVGFGTYPLVGTVCQNAVEEAIHSGYRIIDTATRYKNFDAIGNALKGKSREQFYLISKVWHDQQAQEQIYADAQFTLHELGIAYLDAYLVHWPNSSIPIEETLGAMEKLKQEKKIRHIGLSNVTVNHLTRALETGSTITWVQSEMHPYFYDAKLLDFCKEKGIGMQAWSPLGRGAIGQDPLLEHIGTKHGKTAAQVALKWIVQHGCIPIPNSANPEHIHENLHIHDFTLSADDVRLIDERARGGQRLRPKRQHIGFNDEFDFAYEECWPSRT